MDDHWGHGFKFVIVGRSSSLNQPGKGRRDRVVNMEQKNDLVEERSQER